MLLAKLPVVKPKKNIKLLNILGYLETRRAGGSHRKHIKQVNGIGRTAVIIPYHSNSEIPKGTLRSIKKDISDNENLSEEYILKMLEEI